VDLVTVVTSIIPSGGLYSLIALGLILTFVLIISLRSADPGRAAAMIILALRGKAYPELGAASQDGGSTTRRRRRPPPESPADETR